ALTRRFLFYYLELRSVVGSWSEASLSSCRCAESPVQYVAVICRNMFHDLERCYRVRRMDTTIAKGLRLLNRIAHADAPVGVTAMAKEMGLEKSNVHRTLTTLMTLGHVQKDG